MPFYFNPISGTLDFYVAAIATPISIANGGFGLSGAITNDASSGTVNALAIPTHVIRLTDAPTIAGITAGTSGQQLVVINDGTATITFKHEAGTASAANRITLPTAIDIPVPVNSLISLVYDGNDSRWKVRGCATNWLLGGNAGTTAGTHYLGSTDNVDVVVKANNSEKMRWISGGKSFKNSGSISASDINSTNVMWEMANAGSQSIVGFTFSNVFKVGWRADSSGNMNYHATGSQGHRFYGSMGLTTVLGGWNSTGLIIGGTAGESPGSKLDVRGTVRSSSLSAGGLVKAVGPSGQLQVIGFAAGAIPYGAGSDLDSEAGILNYTEDFWHSMSIGHGSPKARLDLEALSTGLNDPTGLSGSLDVTGSGFAAGTGVKTYRRWVYKDADQQSVYSNNYSEYQTSEDFDPSSGGGSTNYGSGSYTANGDTITYRVYSRYNSSTEFSPNYTEIILTDDSSTNPYYNSLSWTNPSATSDVRIIRDINGGGFNDYYDMSGSSWDDDNTAWTAGSTVTPAVDYNVNLTWSAGIYNTGHIIFDVDNTRYKILPAATLSLNDDGTGWTAGTPTTTPTNITLPALKIDKVFYQKPMTAPTSYDGWIWYDGTQLYRAQNIGGLEQSFVCCVFTGTADATVSNTTSETTLLPSGEGTLTLPANILTVGKSIRLKAKGIYSTVNPAGTLNIKFKFGSTTIISTGAQTLTNSITNMFWEVDVLLTCRSTGGTGTVIAQSGWLHNDTAQGQPYNWQMISTATTTIDTTASQTIDLTATFGTADVGNIITTTNVAIEVLN